MGGEVGSCLRPPRHLELAEHARHVVLDSLLGKVDLLADLPVGLAISDQGQDAFAGVCAPCHGMQGQGLIGPAIASSPTLQDPKALLRIMASFV